MIKNHVLHPKMCQKKWVSFLAWLMMAARSAVRESYGDLLPWAQLTLSAAVAFYSGKGKHLLLTDYIWQAYVSDT